jgi:CubicO group peptidase (beta-lactamase class C family)
MKNHFKNLLRRVNKNLSFYLSVLLLLSLMLISSACQAESITQNIQELTAPVQENDGWSIGTPADVGLRDLPIVSMLGRIQNTSDHKIHSILIVKDSKLVFEKYYDGYLYLSSPPQFQGSYVTYGTNTLHFMASVTKSITSLLFGIAVDQKLIGDVNETMASYYQNYQSKLTGGKENITLRHLLTMTSGLAWDESSSYGNAANDVFQLFQKSDPIGSIISKDLISAPGTSFHYNSGNINILANIIKIKYGQNLKIFAKNFLYQPLGITQYQWDMLNGDNVFASGGAYLSSRSLAKIGQLILNRGSWNGVRVVSQQWIDESLQNHVFLNGSSSIGDSYGYCWWLKTYQNENRSFRCYIAAGWGGQYLYIFPDQKMLVVITSGYFTSSVSISPSTLLTNYILPAVQ